MTRTARFGCLLLPLIVTQPIPANAQGTRDPAAASIPLSSAILRAHAAGTRDSTGLPGPNYWQLRVDYELEARLDVPTSTVHGHGIVVIHNTSPEPLTFIQLRLDQNRFLRGTAAAENVPVPTEGIAVTRLVVNGQSATIGSGDATPPYLTGTRTTSERVMLARAVAAGESARLEMDWHFEVPLDEQRAALRQGRWGKEVYQVAQWYPRVAMLDDLNGWDTSSHDGSLEFYSPYGRFDVRIDVPAGWLVGATGVLRNAADVLSTRTRDRLARVLETDSVVTVVDAQESGATPGGERVVWHFVADTVRDFAWGASPSYIWKAFRVEIPERSFIPVHLLYTSRNASAYERAPPVLRHELAFNSSLIMLYAYPQYTLLDGPEGGMEYPMLTMSHGAGAGHELWHQWFPMMVGSNETWYAFMDEGFATFLAGVTTEARTGLPREEFGRGGDMVAPLIWPDDRGPPSAFAGVYGYGRPARMFQALGDSVGDERVLQGLRGYARAWRFRHPSPWDFMFFMNRALDRDLSAFWYRWLFTTEPAGS